MIAYTSKKRSATYKEGRSLLPVAAGCLGLTALDPVALRRQLSLGLPFSLGSQFILYVIDSIFI
jgi:hypothetical protein